MAKANAPTLPSTPCHHYLFTIKSVINSFVHTQTLLIFFWKCSEVWGFQAYSTIWGVQVGTLKNFPLDGDVLLVGLFKDVLVGGRLVGLFKDVLVADRVLEPNLALHLHGRLLYN